MSLLRSLSIFILVVVVGVVLQVLLVSAELRETPEKAAVDFAKAYYRLDPAMADRVCADLLESDDPVETMLYKARIEASQRGFSANYLKYQLFHVRTSVIEREEDNARVRLLTERKKAIHPAFAYFAKIWGIGATHHEEIVYDLVLEDGVWKVCGEGLFDRFSG